MMSGWGIADTAPKIEKIKAESADYLHGLDSCGIISWSTYSDMFDFYADLIEKAYAQGKEDAQPEIIHCENCKHWKNNHLCECLSRYGTFETPKDFFCGYGKAK
jgi:hypothetical protein